MTIEINTPSEGHKLVDELFDPDTRIPDSIQIRRNDEEIAVVLRQDAYRRLVRFGEQPDWDVLQRLQYRNRHWDPDEVQRDIDEAIEEVRRERLSERRKSA